MAKYESHCDPTKISATSRAAVKIRDNFYTIEAAMEKTVNNTEGIDIKEEFQMLFDELNEVTDYQTKDIIDTFKK